MMKRMIPLQSCHRVCELLKMIELHLKILSMNKMCLNDNSLLGLYEKEDYCQVVGFHMLV